MKRLTRLFRRDRRCVSTKLTPRYEARRVRELQKAREKFGVQS